MELTLNSIKIYELGEYISKYLNDNGLTQENDLVVNVTKEQLRKIDEDLYYRNKPEGQKFENLNMIFTSEKEQEGK